MTEHRDYVALEWVKGEIEETLKQAEQALEAYVESPEDGTRMRFCLTYIHQVHGTLQMVEFYGAALLAEEMEKVAQALINNKVPEPKEAQEVLMQAILQLPGYLEHLQSGREDIPVTLLPLLNDLRSACGESLLTETSLFSPNLSPLKSEGEFSFASSEIKQKLKRLREAYKLGFLGIIRNTGLDKSYATLAKACMHLEQLCGEAPMARLWWIAGAVIEGMSNNTVEDSFAVKTLLRQLEKEIGRLIADGDKALNDPVPEELAKNLLYYVAKSKSETPSVRSIKQVFGLTAALPEDQGNQALQGSYKSAMGSVVEALSEELANLKERFDLFTRSSEYDFERLTELATSFKQIADTLAVLGLGPQRKALLDQIDKINHWVSEQEKPEHSELMSIASELLMVEVGLNASASRKAKSTVTSDIPIDALNTAQSAVVKECRNGLEQVKDAIIGYIASQWNASEIAPVPELLKGVEGALAMVPQLSQASSILSQTREIIESRLLSETPEEPTWDMMDSLADAVAGVDYYLERVAENSQEEGGSVLQVAAESIASLTGQSLESLGFEAEDTPLSEHDYGDEIDLDVAAEDSSIASVDDNVSLDLPVLDETVSDSAEDANETIELAAQSADDFTPEFSEKGPIAGLEESLSEVPDDEELPELELDSIDLNSTEDALGSDIPVLETSDDGLDLGLVSEERTDLEFELPDVTDDSLIPQLEVEEEIELGLDADIPEITTSDDLNVGMASDDELASLLEEETVITESAEVSADSASENDAVPETAAETEESDSMIDDEIIEIFIEEAEEVQETIAEFLPQYKADYENIDAQTEVRRAFHTLKGSGRLVGAEQVGELAWKIENMLNRVIDQTIQASPDLFALIDDVCGVLPELVSAFAKGEKAAIDTQSMMDAADGIVDGKPYQAQDLQEQNLEDQSLENTSEEISDLDVLSEVSLDTADLNADIDVNDVEEELSLDQLTASEDSLASDDTEEFDLAPEDITAQLAESLSIPDSELDTLPTLESLSETDDLSDEILLDSEESSSLLEIFRGEALTHLDVLDAYVEENLYKDSALLTDDVQRACHTLKGSAHMAAVTPIADFAGTCEKVVKEARAAHLLADQLLVSQLKDAANWIREAVAELESQVTVTLEIDSDWLETFTNSQSRLPSETRRDDADAPTKVDTSPDHQMMNIFLMEGMDILGDIELVIQQWRADALSTQLANDLDAEFETLAKAARMARVNAFADVAEALNHLIKDIIRLDGTPNAQFFDVLDSGYESLVSLMDLLAAGQALASTEAKVSEVNALSRPELVDPLENVTLEDVPELATSGVHISEDDFTSLVEAELSESLEELELADSEEDDFTLDELASDDDLAALVDEFDEYGSVQDAESIEATEVVESVAEDEEEDSELVSIFLEEADDIVSHLDENLQQWRGQLDNAEPVQELQRAIHTLKGGARLAEIKPIGDLCHELENLYEGLSEGRFGFSEPLIELLQDCHDAIATQVSDIHENKEPVSYPELEQRILNHMSSATESESLAENNEIDELREQADQELVDSAPQSLSENVDPELVEIFLEEAEEILDSITEHLEQWADQQDDLTPVAELQRELHTLKGGARMAELSPVGDLGHELENLYEGLVNGMFTSSEELIELLRSCHDRLGDMIEAVQRQHMPSAAPDLIEAITQYCRTGSYDEAVLHQSSNLTSMDSESDDTEEVKDAIEVVDSEDVVLEPEAEAQDDFDLASLDQESVTSDSDELSEIDTLLPDLDVDESLDDSDVDDSNFEAALSELDLGDTDSSEDSSVEFVSELDDSDTTLSELPDDQVTADDNDFDLSVLGISALDAAALEVSEIFIEEASELAELLDNACHAWAQDPYGSAQKDEVLRVLHTLKGGAKLAKLDVLAQQSHDLETHVEESSDDLTEAFFVDLLERVDQIGQAIEELSSGASHAEDGEDKLDSITDHSQILNEDIPELDLSEIESELESSFLEEPSQADDVSADVFELSDEDLLEELTHLDDDEEAPEELILGDEILAERIPAPEFGPSIREALLDQNAKMGQEAVKVSADLLENLVNLAGETSITRGRLETEVSDIGFTLEDMDMTVSRLRDQLKRLDIETQAQISYRTEMQQTHAYDDFDPLEMDRYTNMQQLSRALLESVTDILDLRATLENKVRDSETLLLQQSRINTELQEGLMKTRMVPFSRLVPRLRRIVRQVAQELGKQVDFKVNNAEGEMDRTVMERMVAPLEHMLRNAVDHGVEMPDVRKKAGKKAKGTIELSVSREGGDVVLRLNDDGAGVNLEAVRNKAIERNLMKPDADLTEHEVMQFIFSPGFSTAQKVTQISGRGVGMDVVNSEIKQLGGNITIDSEYGNGSEFEVRLPFTVSMNRALMVKVGDDLYAVPLNTIEGIVRVSPYELEEFYKEGVEMPYNYAGKEYRMEYMGTLLKSGHRPKLQGQVLPLPVLLVRGAEHPIALQVDSLMGSREVVVKSLGAQFSSVDGVSGATILGDGSVVIILDLAALIRAEHARYIEQANQDLVAAEETTSSDRPLKVMVVDDSVTVRKVTSRVLQRQGYEVFTAKDGVDAIAKLQDERPDIMLLDIEMPRMDGFEVASHVRHNEQIKDLPIIMITSRTGEKHRDRAMSIGVNHYMGKPFQEATLLETIELLVGK
ncbi:Hpt domain-containing protein [Litoribrevibacter euphylliae]|uniref:histidine kinase n=1 Tax=Litoribrevibacter euphylliae TaxID=1834034 RepID=A0ABV7HDQ1_9GAMM